MILRVLNLPKIILYDLLFILLLPGINTEVRYIMVRMNKSLGLIDTNKIPIILINNNKSVLRQLSERNRANVNERIKI